MKLKNIILKSGTFSRWIIFIITGISVFIISSGIFVSLFYIFDIPSDWFKNSFVFNDLPKDIPGFNDFTRTVKAKLVIADAISISLAFLLAASIIEQTIIPDYYHLGILGILVTLHVVIGYMVNAEIENAIRQNRRWEKERASETSANPRIPGLGSLLRNKSH